MLNNKLLFPLILLFFGITAPSIFGQNLDFSAGEWMVVGIAMGGTTTRPYGMAVPGEQDLVWFNLTDSENGFPTNPRTKSTVTNFPSIEIITS